MPYREINQRIPTFVVCNYGTAVFKLYLGYVVFIKFSCLRKKLLLCVTASAENLTNRTRALLFCWKCTRVAHTEA